MIYVFGIYAVLEVWFKGSVFAEKRAFLEAEAESYDERWLEEQCEDSGVRWTTRYIWWFTHVLTCRLCLSVYVAFVGSLFLWPILFLSFGWLTLFMILPYMLGGLGAVYVLETILARIENDRPNPGA